VLLEYKPNWQGRKDSNHRPSVLEFWAGVISDAGRFVSLFATVQAMPTNDGLL